MSSTTTKQTFLPMSINTCRNKKLVAVSKDIARQLRRHQTNSEAIFWEAVRNNQFLNLKFYRQHPLYFEYVGKESFFIADFYCHEKQLVIEIDGPIHRFQTEYDQLRDHLINSLGIRVLRFTNQEIETTLNEVLHYIKLYIHKKDSTPLLFVSGTSRKAARGGRGMSSITTSKLS